MKVIFLDLDSVINSHAFYPIDPYCVNILKEIINQTKAKIVITSANKYPFQKKEQPMNKVPFIKIISYP